jgi:hypothetical protein
LNKFKKIVGFFGGYFMKTFNAQRVFAKNGIGGNHDIMFLTRINNFVITSL